MVTRLPIVTSLVAGAICAAIVDVYGWEIARTWVIPALSIVGAAVLVRLARGVPITNPDHIRTEDIDAVTEAFTSLARSLRTLLFVVIAAIILVGAVSPMASFLARVAPVDFDYGNRAASGFVGLTVGYCFARILQIAQSDVSIANLQAKILREAVARREAKSFKESSMQASSFRQPEGYGKSLQ